MAKNLISTAYDIIHDTTTPICKAYSVASSLRTLGMKDAADSIEEALEACEGAMETLKEMHHKCLIEQQEEVLAQTGDVLMALVDKDSDSGNMTLENETDDRG